MLALKRIVVASTLALLSVAACAGSDPAAAILTTSLPGLDGRVHRIADWNGKIRVVNFWATWCAPCRAEIPLLSATRKHSRSRGVEVIGVAVDAPDEVRAYANETRIGYPVLIAQQRGQALMQAGGNAYGALPYTLLLDRRGKIVQRHAGVLDERRLRQWLADAAARN